MKLKEVFNKTTTTNGDDAFLSSGNKYVDILFRLTEFRHNPTKIPYTLSPDSEIDMLFSMYIRDPRYGTGEREVGRQLMLDTKVPPYLVLAVGRADDIFFMGSALHKLGSKDNIYWEFLKEFILRDPSADEEDPMTIFNLKKWLPRLRNNKLKRDVTSFIKYLGVTPKEYRQSISINTTVEAILSRRDFIPDYSKVPSLAMLKYFKSFKAKDAERFEAYLNMVKQGSVKINTGTTTPVDIWNRIISRDISLSDAQTIWDNLPKVEMPKILCMVDQSGSMFGFRTSKNDPGVKARALAKYVAENSSYMKNTIITFSSSPKLLELGDSLESADRVFRSYSDYTNTDFGKAMQVISQVTEDLPDYLLVFSDMQFDSGSNRSKDDSMKIIRNYNPNLKIIWWNLATDKTTFPETDSYGNIMLSGYNPTMLQYLGAGFDNLKFISKLLLEYTKKINFTI